LGALNRQREGLGSGGAVASPNGRARAGVTQWGQGDVSLVASTSGGAKESCVQSRLMACRAWLRAIMSLPGVRACWGRGLGFGRERGGRWPAG
jgi:hypothetical protein